MVTTPPPCIIVSFKEAKQKLANSFIDQNLPALPLGWIVRVVFDNIYKNGIEQVATEEIQSMCWQITETWYDGLEHVDHEEFFTVKDIVAMILHRVTQFHHDIENTLNVWGILEAGKLKYQLKDFVNDEDAVFVRRESD